MKTIQIKAISSLLAIAALVLTFAGCSDESSESKQDAVKAKLIASPWNVGGVMVDGVDQSSVYPDLKVTFTSTGFTSTNGGVIWPSTASWVFTSEEATAIELSNGMVVDILQITDNVLKLGLEWEDTTIGPGRVKSIGGEHVFTFGK